jgi:hypothetical protein
MKKLFLRACLSILSLSTTATSFADEDISYEINSDRKSVSIASHNICSGKVSIPPSVIIGGKT